jgi:hypothetical protein
MEIKRKYWKVLNKGQLLLALMGELEGGARISFEGGLRATRLLSLPGASFEPAGALKRNTQWPEQDFTVIPLEPSSSKKIYSALGGTIPKTVLHVQIEKNGTLQFGAYDNFHPECIFFGTAIKQEFIDSLISKGMLGSG